MDDKSVTCEKLFLLVGSNPLPNFLATLMLKPKSVHFFYTPETERVKNTLMDTIKHKCGLGAFGETCIEDATHAAKVRTAFGAIPREAHLHYTGGTKIMAAHARMAFREAGGTDDQASYLDERKGVLRFDHGREIHLEKASLNLTMNDVLKLHGIEPIHENGRFPSKRLRVAAEKILEMLLKERERVLNLFKIAELKFSDAKKQPRSIKDFGLDLSISQVPENDWNERTYKRWCKFLRSGWLEIWCGSLVRNVAQESQVVISLDCRRSGGRQFEIDVALVRGFRLYVISCTTDERIERCKSKIFEVAMRARQMGGDLARSALVCLMHEADSKGPFVDQLRSDVADIWDAPNTPRVFALDELKEWAGIDGPKNTRSLQEWLDS